MRVAPFVSVVLPARNAEATLPAALASLRRQSFGDWECVVVDDGSTDATARVVARAAALDARIGLITAPQRGLVNALNAGIDAASGALIARMDADDLMHRHRLARQIAALAADRRLAAVGCHVRLFPRRGVSPRRREYERWLNSLHSADDVIRDALVECPVAHPTLVMRRDMARLGYRDRRWPEDYDLVLRALAQGLRIGIVPERLLSWRQRPDSWSRTSADYGIDRFTACKADYLATGFLKHVDSYVLWGYGDTGRTLRHALSLHGKTPSHIVEVKTSRLGQRIHGATVVPIAQVSRLAGRPIVVSVARAGPRAQIRAVMAQLGFVEGAAFVCAA